MQNSANRFKLAWLQVGAAVALAATTGCSSELDVDIVDHQICRGIHATVLCPTGVNDGGERFTFADGIASYQPDVCRSRRLRLQYNVHPIPVPDLSPTSASLLEILEDDAATDGFSLVARPSDFSSGVAFALVCETEEMCAQFLGGRDVEFSLAFDCEGGAPVAVEISAP